MIIKDPNLINHEIFRLQHEAKRAIVKARNEAKSKEPNLYYLIGLLHGATGDIEQIVALKGEIQELEGK